VADSAESAKLQILSTEHWSLLATRSLGYTDSFSRANMFFSVLSGAVIALALIAQAGRFDETFLIAAILLLPIVFFVGIATVARLGHLNYEDARWVMGMNRIRHGYLELHPELAPYFITGSHDDVRGVMTTFGINAAMPGQHLLSDMVHGMQTLPGMVTVVVAVVGGTWIALVTVALGGSQPLSVGLGAVGFFLTIVANAISARRAVRSAGKGFDSKFPSPD
jgi:hypothetical protein